MSMLKPKADTSFATSSLFRSGSYLQKDTEHGNEAMKVTIQTAAAEQHRYEQENRANTDSR